MNDEEIRRTIEELKAQVKAKPENKDKSDDEIDEMILDGFFDAFKDGEMSREDLMAIAEAMGYEPTEEFKNEEAPDPIEAKEMGDGNLDKKELEETKVMQPGESKEEFKEKVEDVKDDADKKEESEDESEEEESDEEEEFESEDEEREKASELFGVNLRKDK
jgi:hypothetical protein